MFLTNSYKLSLKTFLNIENKILYSDRSVSTKGNAVDMAL